MCCFLLVPLNTQHMKLIISYLSFLFVLSCSKKDSPPPDTAPTDLVLTAVVSTNNSGQVQFTATAVNAVNYSFDLGNGITQHDVSGVITYKYWTSGTYQVTVTAKSATGKTASKSTSITVLVTLSLAWSDEFEVTGAPDPSKWGYDLGDGCPNVCGWGNNELQWYTNRPENVVVAGGVLKITAIKESMNGKAYTSARILSKDKFSFKYGKMEVKAKLPAGVGTWPAIWMLGNNINTVGWPASGEIDVMEHRGSHQNTISGALHHPGRSGGSADVGTTVISNASTEFHIYSVEWFDNAIKFSVDNTTYFTFINKGNLPFNHPFFIIMNVAMGGNYGGPVDPAFSGSSMEVDYVRVYQ